MTASAKAQRLRVHYIRRDGVLQGWGLHIWGDVQQETQWATPLAPSGTDEAGIYWDIMVPATAAKAGFLVHKGDEKAAGGELALRQGGGSSNGGNGSGGELPQNVWLVADSPQVLTQQPKFSDVPAGSMTKQSAHWVTSKVMLWRHAASDSEGTRKFQLHFSSSAGLRITGAGVEGSEEVHDLETLSSSQLPADVEAMFPYLKGTTVFGVPASLADKIPHLLQGQLVVSMSSASGVPLDATGVQVQGILDESFYTDAPLGDANGHISVWAPTAQSVELLHWKTARGGEPEVHTMTAGAKGVWSLQKPQDWLWTYYLYRIKVYCPCSQKVETLEVADPYSRGLAANGERTQIVDLDDDRVTPAGWREERMPPLPWSDISLYELHIRDFSQSDKSVPEALRGKYLAFVPEHAAPDGKLTAGLAHLAALREAGLSHLHLLPFYDYATVPERPDEQKSVTVDLASFPSDSECQQAAIGKIHHEDAFNWGYDPFCWGVPEGSYATDPDSHTRILECRTMIQSLHRQGWRVVPDMVYNHVFAANNERYSLLDKVVPGYYMRREEDGGICQSTCCNNTASEHAMCERLVVDDCEHWAKNYKVDGYRFDIMAHMRLSTMQKIRERLDKLTVEKDGVSGKDLYIYGEAWEFGEVTGGRRGVVASQFNLSGSKLGSFNERLRDGALGGGPFCPPDLQGFATGLALQPNRSRDQGGPKEQMQELLVLSDWVRWALAGNLRQYSATAADGRTVRGDEIVAHGDQPLTYGSHPCEHISYIGCHDNQTMFDMITEKVAAEVSPDDRQRVAGICLSLIILAQGIPFIHAGDDLLRSKSLDKDSYNSGDWFNKIDWTGNDNNFGVGLPNAFKNGYKWSQLRPLLADVQRNKPGPEQIQRSAAHVRTMLRVRYSSPLFRLPEAEDVQRQVAFHNTGPKQVPGVVVMELTSAASASGPGVHDPEFMSLLVVFNASPSVQSIPVPPALSGGTSRLRLHPILAGHPDPAVQAARVEGSGGTVSVQPRTTAVFVAPRN